MISHLLAWAAAAVLISYSIALSYWALRVAVDRHPLSEPEKERWVPWLLLCYAAAGIEVPYVALFVAVVCAGTVAQAHTLAGVGMAILLFAAFLWYQYADALDDRRYRERHHLGPRN